MATQTKPKDKKVIPLEKTAYIITAAALKDGFCHYTFEITEGKGVGDTHQVKGNGLFLDDLRHAFGKLNVHMACIDDVFKHSGIEIEDIDMYHTDDLASLYNVTGIKIKGGKENESVILLGNKYVSSAGGRIELASPKIPIDNLSSYKWYNELKTAVDEIRREVKLYKEGKYTAVEEEEAEDNPKQMKITDMMNNDTEGDDDDSEFSNSRV